MPREEDGNSEALLVNLGVLLPSAARFWHVWECLVNRRDKPWKSHSCSGVHGNIKRVVPWPCKSHYTTLCMKWRRVKWKQRMWHGKFDLTQKAKEKPRKQSKTTKARFPPERTVAASAPRPGYLSNLNLCRSLSGTWYLDPWKTDIIRGKI